MVVTLRTLGLALIAALVLTAAAASAASASEFTADTYPATVEGSQLEQHTFTADAGTTHCGKADFHGTLGAASPTLVITPAYTGCSLTPLGFATVKMNGCDYLFHSGAAIAGVEDAFHGTVDVVCPGANQIEVVVPLACTVRVGPQSGLETVKFQTNTIASPNTVIVTAAVSGIKHSQTGSLCTNGSFQNGTYNGTVQYKGTNELEEAIGFYVK